MNEESYIRRIRDGERAAMRELYSCSVAYLAGVCQRYVTNQEDVKDVLQDSYVQIFQHIGDFSPKSHGSLRSWMARIVANKSIDLLRKQRQLQWETDSDIADIPDEPLDPKLVRIETMHQLIRQLPPGYRAVLNLYVFEQKSHREIAELLGIKEKTSASQYLRAKAMLKKLMLNHINNER